MTYGINPFTLTDYQRHFLSANIPHIQAQQELQKRKQEAPLTNQRVFDLLYLATYGDLEKAELAQAKFMLKQAKGSAQENE